MTPNPENQNSKLRKGELISTNCIVIGLMKQIVGSIFHSKQAVPLAVTHGNATWQFAPLDTLEPEKNL